VFPLLISIRAEIVEQYYEFFWAIPVTLIIAGGAVAAIFMIKNKAAHVLLIIACVILILVFGTPSLRNVLNLSVSEDFTKADAEVMYLCDYIKSHADKDKPYVAFDSPYCATEAMMYDASIRISNLLNGDSEKKVLTEDFIVISAPNLQLGDRLSDLGYTDVPLTNTYHIYSKNPVR
jgi:hypothetical protein